MVCSDPRADGRELQAPSSASTLQSLQVCDEVADLIRVEAKFRHRRVSGNNALGQSLRQILDRIFSVQVAERRRNPQGAVTDTACGVTLPAIRAGESLADRDIDRLGDGRIESGQEKYDDDCCAHASSS